MKCNCDTCDKMWNEERHRKMRLRLRYNWKSAFTARTAIVSNSSLYVGNEVEKNAEKAEDAGQQNITEEK